MGLYLNPGNTAFSDIVRSSYYVDKSGLIEKINTTIHTPQRLTCVSRPRRFGKSFAAQMLCAYYDCSCDSRNLFQSLAISRCSSYETHRNQYPVIYLDMTNLLGKTDSGQLIAFLSSTLEEEILQEYPEISRGISLDQTMIHAVEYTGKRFIMIIDEWDAPIREYPEISKSYLNFLRMLFKSSGTTARIFAGVYMTGILPIKKDGSQSAISDFREYTMTDPGDLAEFIGFTEHEVADLCERYKVDFSSMKQWYDGYVFPGTGSVYNPNSVILAVQNRRFRSYWTQTSAADSLLKYLSKGYSGFDKSIAELMAGLHIKVEILGFQNDLVTFANNDDIITLLIHLGYLSYNSEQHIAQIPNEEIRMEFNRIIRNVSNQETIKRLRESDELFEATFRMDEEAVAAQIEKIHEEETTPLFYNREESLRSVIKLAYYTYKDHYLQWEEMPAGSGYADIVYFPKKDSGYPILVIELKWNDSSDNAIQQILAHNYPAAFRNYGSEILLVGISYDKNAPAGQRKHHCRIEKMAI